MTDTEDHHHSIADEALAQLFRDARTHNGFVAQPVPESLLVEAVDLAKMGPTSANCSPMRVVFATSAAAKERLKPSLAPGNLAKMMEAPVTAIVATDYAFYEHLPTLFPHADAKAWFVGNAPLIETTAFRNATLQAGYLILALRAVGLDVGPMSGFDNAKVDAEFFGGTATRSNFLINIGYGDAAKLYPRSPRFDFAVMAKIV